MIELNGPSKVNAGSVLLDEICRIEVGSTQYASSSDASDVVVDVLTAHARAGGNSYSCLVGVNLIRPRGANVTEADCVTDGSYVDSDCIGVHLVGREGGCRSISDAGVGAGDVVAIDQSSEVCSEVQAGPGNLDDVVRNVAAGGCAEPYANRSTESILHHSHVGPAIECQASASNDVRDKGQAITICGGDAAIDR